MSYPTKTLHPDEKIKAGDLGKKISRVGAGIAVVGLAISLVLTMSSGADPAAAGHVSKWSRFLHAYVIGWSYIASISIGMMWLILLHYLVRGRWVTVVRRLCEAMASAFPVVWIVGLGFVLPVLAGNKDLYYWTTDAAHDPILNHALAHKLGWLSPGFWGVRYIAYGAIYSGLAWYFAKKSREQDESGDAKITDHLRVVAGPGMILFAFTTCFLAFDVLMSLLPKWYSTIYGVSFWASGCVGAFSALALLVLYTQRTGRLVHSINEEHYHDIGKWMFSFTFFWAYTAFSQFMLQWYGNLPEETVFYKYRMFGDWQWMSIAILVGYWAFPFVFLMSRWTKRIKTTLVFFAVWQLVFHWIDLYWNVMPNYDWSVHDGLNVGPLAGPIANHHVGLSGVDVTVWIAMIGFLLVGIGRNLKGNLIPVKDPTLGLSLAHEQL